MSTIPHTLLCPLPNECRSCVGFEHSLLLNAELPEAVPLQSFLGSFETQASSETLLENDGKLDASCLSREQEDKRRGGKEDRKVVKVPLRASARSPLIAKVERLPKGRWETFMKVCKHDHKQIKNTHTERL